MIEECRIIYPYYDNPTMLEKQVENWNRYAGELRDKIKIILVDDGSPNHPAAPIFEKCKAPKALFRIKQNIPWNQHGARNLGAKEACKKEENLWMFMSDMDIILTPEMAFTMLSSKPNPLYHYTFERKFAPDFIESKYHCNTFMVKHNAYWAVGGYDEDYCGTYGGDGPFLRQLNVVAPRMHMPKVVLYGYKETEVCDANTQEWGRKETEWSKKYREIFDKKRAKGDERSRKQIRFDWERIF